MSSKIPLGKVEWLKSVRIAMTGFIGIGLLLTVLELGGIWSNPDDILMWVIPINWHFLQAIQIGFVTLVAIIIYYFAVLPGELGNLEAKAKLFYLNWMQKVDKVDEFLAQLEQELNGQNDGTEPKIPSKMDNTNIVPDTRINNAPVKRD